MIEETLSSTTPKVNNPAGPQVKTPVAGAVQATTKKSASSTSVGQTAERHKRLVTHLLIGFMMTVVAIAGYTFLGPYIDANAAEQAGSHFVNVATDVPLHTSAGPYDSSHPGDLTAIQAEMNAITNEMNMLMDGSLPVNTTATTGNSPVTTMSYSNASGNDLDQALSTLDQMMLTMHGMIDKVNGLSNQQGGMNTPADTSGHGHH